MLCGATRGIVHGLADSRSHELRAGDREIAVAVATNSMRTEKTV